MSALPWISLALVIVAALRSWLRPPRRSELEEAAAFWRRAALRAAWRGDEAVEAYAERQYRACEEQLREGATKGPTE